MFPELQSTRFRSGQDSRARRSERADAVRAVSDGLTVRPLWGPCWARQATDSKGALEGVKIFALRAS
eukprot:656254-Pyramimonas_sp.AAC.1